MRTCLAGLLVAVSLALLAGCAANPESPQVRASARDDAAGPRALMAKWHHSLATGDKTQYLSCFTGSKDDLVLALAVFDAIQANYAFHNAVVATYGPDGWKAFQASEGARIDLFPREERWLARITVVPMGQMAFSYLPRGRVPMHMLHQDGAWHIQAASLTTPGFEAKRAADYLFRWAATLRQLIPQITARGVTAEKATKDVRDDFKAKVAPAEAPAAAEAVDSFLTF